MRISRHGAIEEKLVEGEFALENVALGEANFGFKFAWRAHFRMQHQFLETRRVVLNLVENGLAKGIAVVVRPLPAFESRWRILHEAAHEVLARRRHRGVDGGGDHHVEEGITGEMPGLPVVIGHLHARDGIGEMHITANAGRILGQCLETGQAIERDVHFAG